MVTVLKHHGIKGMHWGVRRYQNPDGSPTTAGRKRQESREEYVKKTEKIIRSNKKILSDLEKEQKLSDKQFINKRKKEIDQLTKEYMEFGEMSKKDAKKELLQEYRDNVKKDIDYRKNTIDEDTKAIKQIKSTPINKLTVVEASNRTIKIATGSAVAGAAAGIGISVALKKAGLINTGQMITTGMGLGTAGFLTGTFVGFSKAENHYKKKGIEGRIW